jgi:hypothetical protein
MGRWRGARRGAGPSPAAPVRTSGPVPGTGLSSDYCVSALAGCPAWTAWWQGMQTTRVFLRMVAMRCAHAGCGRPGLVRSASLRTWWISTVACCSHHSHRRARSRAVSPLAAGGRSGLEVGEDRLFLPYQRDAAEPCDQWFPACPFDACPNDPERVRRPAGLHAMTTAPEPPALRTMPAANWPSSGAPSRRSARSTRGRYLPYAHFPR